MVIFYTLCTAGFYNYCYYVLGTVSKSLLYTSLISVGTLPLEGTGAVTSGNRGKAGGPGTGRAGTRGKAQVGVESRWSTESLSSWWSC